MKTIKELKQLSSFLLDIIEKNGEILTQGRIDSLRRDLAYSDNDVCLRLDNIEEVLFKHTKLIEQISEDLKPKYDPNFLSDFYKSQL